MPRTLAARIAVAFGVLAIVLWLAIGAGMFVVLRGLHADATSSSLADVAQTFAVRLRSAAVDRDLQRVVATIRTEVAQADVTIHVIGDNGRIVDVGAGDPSPTEPIAVPGDAKVGQAVEGMVAYTDGEVHDYAAVVLRAPASGAGRTILLSTIDRSGAAALRDVGRTLPGVILVTLLVGAPLVWLLARSVAGPLARLATRTRELTEPAASPPEPLALEGPKEVRALTERVNAMAAELALIRARETELLADLRHDLRTPLTVIGGYAAALADGTANGEAATRAAAAIEDETARLGRLVDELGAVERLRNGSAGLRLEPIAVDEVLRVTAERFTARASSDGSTTRWSKGRTGSRWPPTDSRSTGSSLTSSTTRWRSWPRGAEVTSGCPQGSWSRPPQVRVQRSPSASPTTVRGSRPAEPSGPSSGSTEATRHAAGRVRVWV
jgi:hypothetical protein